MVATKRVTCRVCGTSRANREKLLVHFRVVHPDYSEANGIERQPRHQWDADLGGTTDGFSVFSDADPGL